MLHAELSTDLILATGVLLLCVAVMLRRVLPLKQAIPLALVKTWIPFIYFAFFFNGQWTILDDVTYVVHAEKLLAEGFSPILSLGDKQFYIHMVSLSGGINFLYTWWTTLALWIFGDHYWSPVYLNVLVSTWSALTLNGILSDWQFPEDYRRGGVLVLVLNGDLLTWSSFVNLKDVLVMALSLIALRAIGRLTSGGANFPTVLAAALSLIMVTAIRFYVPLLVVGAACIWMLIISGPFHRPLFTIVVCAAFVAVGAWALPHAGGDLKLLRPDEIGFGLLRFLFTPQPWSVDRDYTFLFVPSVIDWALMPLLAFGLLRLWHDAPQSRLLIVYAALTASLYAIATVLQGPRQRVQILPMISLAIFHGAYRLMYEARRGSWFIGRTLAQS